MAQFQNPYVLSFIAIVLDDPLMVILEYAELGDLLGYLKKHAATMTEKLRARFAAECADGLCYLHSRGFVHRDVAARNVLLSSGVQCKISDFGMSRDTVDSEYYQSKGGDIPVRWSATEVSAGLVHEFPLTMHSSSSTLESQKSNSWSISPYAVADDPRRRRIDSEIDFDSNEWSCFQHSQHRIVTRALTSQALEKRKFSEASDVWAFGILAYEIWTNGETPYKNFNNQRVWYGWWKSHRRRP